MSPEPHRFVQVAMAADLFRICPFAACHALPVPGNLEWQAKPHQLEIPLEHPSCPVEVVRRVCPWLFQMVQQAKPHQLEIRLVRR